MNSRLTGRQQVCLCKLRAAPLPATSIHGMSLRWLLEKGWARESNGTVTITESGLKKLPVGVPKARL